jgi:hypothetical protein
VPDEPAQPSCTPAAAWRRRERAPKLSCPVRAAGVPRPSHPSMPTQHDSPGAGLWEAYTGPAHAAAWAGPGLPWRARAGQGPHGRAPRRRARACGVRQARGVQREGRGMREPRLCLLAAGAHARPRSASGGRARALICSAVQCSAVQCSAVQCSAVQCRAGERGWSALKQRGQRSLEKGWGGGLRVQRGPRSARPTGGVGGTRPRAPPAQRAGQGAVEGALEGPQGGTKGASRGATTVYMCVWGGGGWGVGGGAAGAGGCGGGERGVLKSAPGARAPGRRLGRGRGVSSASAGTGCRGRVCARAPVRASGRAERDTQAAGRGGKGRARAKRAKGIVGRRRGAAPAGYC